MKWYHPQVLPNLLPYIGRGFCSLSSMVNVFWRCQASCHQSFGTLNSSMPLLQKILSFVSFFSGLRFDIFLTCNAIMFWKNFRSIPYTRTQAFLQTAYPRIMKTMFVVLLQEINNQKHVLRINMKAQLCAFNSHIQIIIEYFLTVRFCLDLRHLQTKWIN